MPEEAQARSTHWQYLGTVPYLPSVKLQEELREQLEEGGSEWLLLLQHHPVYTLGRSADSGDVVGSVDWLRERGIEVHKTDRGGQVTYHGPGQLVGYPILDLNQERDLRRYVRRLQQLLVDVLNRVGIQAHARHEQAEIGVWVEERKIASIGVHLSRWRTTHGFALNVATDLSHFSGIVACGLPDVRMTSIEAELGTAPPVEDIAGIVAACFGPVFGRTMMPAAVPALPALSSASR